MIKLEISGEGLSFDREIQTDKALRIIKMGMSDDIEGGDTTVSLRSEHLSFNRNIPVGIGTKIMQVAVTENEKSQSAGENATIAKEIEEIENLVDEVK